MAKILIVDDEIPILELWRIVLEEDRHQIVVVSVGSQALEAARKEKPDLLILDVMLPGLDGLSIGKALSEDPELRRIPVIVTTARKDFFKLFDKFEQFVGRLEKPARTTEMLEAVRAVLSPKTKPS